jgi:hypothetical protein
MFLADFHVHTNFSDGRLPLPAIVDLYGSLGFGAIAVTDHLCEERTFLGLASAYLGCTLTPSNFPLYRALLESEADRAWRQYRMVVLPGMELTKNSLSNHRSAHVLAVGVDEYIPADLDALDMTRRIREAGGVAIAAHPVHTRKFEPQTYHLWSRRRELEHAFDAWEVASGPHLFDEVADSKLPKIASSDLHHPRQMRSWKTVLDCERHPEAILEAIRRQRVRFHFYEPPAAFERAVQATESAPARSEADALDWAM